MRGKVSTRPVAFAAFDDHNHTTSLAWIIGYGMVKSSIAPSHAK
jgi:hypothetical protein